MPHVSTWRKGKRLSSDDGCSLTFHWLQHFKIQQQVSVEVGSYF